MTEYSRDGSGSQRAAGAGGRVRREDPERTRPNRSWWGIFRPWERQASGTGGRPGNAGNGDGGWSGVVDRAVEMGYRVIDEQIRQGQRAAREFSSQSYGPQSANRDLQELFVRSMRYYADTAALWLDFLGALPGSLGAVANPFAPPDARRAGANGSARQPPPAAGGAPADAEERAISIQVSRPATVTLDLRPGRHGELSVPALHWAGPPMAGEPSPPPLTEVAFKPATEVAAALLRIGIPDEQPAGLYSGVVFDRDHREPRGTLLVQVDG